MSNRFRRLACAYLAAKKAVVQAGLHSEIDWQENRSFSSINESDFLREYAWVVLSSGMKETVIRNKFPIISEAFFHWVDAQTIFYEADFCKRKALDSFGSVPKINAILKITEEICDTGFEALKERLVDQKEEFLQQFPFMGPATSFHLLKNIGFDVPKPDRHLLRLTSAAGYSDHTQMCADISQVVGDRLAVIDIVLWRYATIEPNYVDNFLQLLDLDCENMLVQSDSEILAKQS